MSLGILIKHENAVYVISDCKETFLKNGNKHFKVCKPSNKQFLISVHNPIKISFIGCYTGSIKPCIQTNKYIYEIIEDLIINQKKEIYSIESLVKFLYSELKFIWNVDNTISDANILYFLIADSFGNVKKITFIQKIDRSIKFEIEDSSDFNDKNYCIIGDYHTEIFGKYYNIINYEFKETFERYLNEFFEGKINIYNLVDIISCFIKIYPSDDLSSEISFEQLNGNFDFVLDS